MEAFGDKMNKISRGWEWVLCPVPPTHWELGSKILRRDQCYDPIRNLAFQTFLTKFQGLLTLTKCGRPGTVGPLKPHIATSGCVSHHIILLFEGGCIAIIASRKVLPVSDSKCGSVQITLYL
jgi:hypothetical protein